MLSGPRGRRLAIVGALALAVSAVTACTPGANASPDTTGGDVVASGEGMTEACLPVTAADPVVTVSNLGLAVLATKGVQWDEADVVGARSGIDARVDFVLPLPKDYEPRSYGIGTYQGYPPALKYGFMSQQTWDTRIAVGQHLSGGNSWYAFIIRLTLKPGAQTGSIDGVDFRYHLQGARWSANTFHTASHLVLTRGKC